MTEDQKSQVIQLYQEGETFYNIYIKTGVPGATAASFLRRKHPQIIKNSRNIRATVLNNSIQRIQTQLGVSNSMAQFLAETTYERFQNKKITARRNNVDFDIEYEDIVFPIICPILGIELDYTSTNVRADNYPTFDRIDNDKGYVKDNVHVVSWRANRLKNNGTLEDFTKLVAFLQEHKNKFTKST